MENKNKAVINCPLITKDSKGNIVHKKNSSGCEFWKEYDENNNLIHTKNSFGTEYWKEYDENNNCIHYKDSDGVEYWWDSNGNEIPNPIKK